MKIGFISFAHLHATAYAEHVQNHPEAELSAIWDADLIRGKEAAKQYGADFYADLEAFLDSGIDAVIICSEDAYHKEHVIKAAKHKKHMLCEKPMATQVNDVLEMIKECGENNVILQIAYPVRFTSPMKQVNEIIKSGEIGEVIAVNATNHGQMPGGWFVKKELSGGGCATDHIVHIIDLLRWIFKDEAKNVYAEFDTRFYNIDVEDCGSVMLEMESGIIVSIDPSWSRPDVFPTWGDVTLDIVGTNGEMSVDVFKQHSVLYSDKDNSIQYQPWGEDMDESLISDFIDCVKTNRKPFITGEDGLRTLEVVKAAYKSNELKQIVVLERN